MDMFAHCYRLSKALLGWFDSSSKHSLETSLDVRQNWFDVQSIAIIGAGPTGLAVAKYLLAEQHFTTVKIFEQQNAVGGIWNFPRGHDTSASTADEYTNEVNFPSPIYDDLESNIPTMVMQYSDLDFPEGTPLLPNRDAISDYIQTYARDVLVHVALQQQVTTLRPAAAGTTWTVTSREVSSRFETEETFDAVVVATGRYDKPYVPDIHGLTAWKEAFPGSISHSKFYHNAEPFRDKKVLIVGWSSSGVDIGEQVKNVCNLPLLVSRKSTGNVSPTAPGIGEKRGFPEIIEFIVKDRSVLFANGHVEDSIDAVVFCTGYTYSYPFLSAYPDFANGSSQQDTYKHIFFNPRPTLAFALLPLRVVAFPFSESQAAIIARIWSNRLELPSRKERDAWTADVHEKRGDGKSFHKFSYPTDADYMNEFHDWCLEAKKKSNLNNDGLGKLPPRWGDKERCHEIRAEVESRGKVRHQLTHLSEVGFDYEQQAKRN